LIRLSTPADLPRLQALLRLSFGAAGGGPVFSPDALDWKYWGSGTSRSTIDERTDSLAAHACAWPATLLTSHGPLYAMHCIDWAADPAYPGAGIAVLESASRTVDFQIGAGGSEITHKLRPALGFKERGRIGVYARVLHPLRHALTHPARNWKTPARIIRSLLQPAAGTSNWQAVAIDPAQPPADFLYPSPAGQLLPFARTPEGLAFWGRCPIARFLAFHVQRNQRPSGYFCLTLTPGQARLADAWTPSEEPADWANLYRLAVDAAARENGINEVRADAVPACCREGLEMAGFTLRQEEPLMVRDRRKRLPDDFTLHYQPVDGDGAFWHAGVPDYRL